MQRIGVRVTVLTDTLIVLTIHPHYAILPQKLWDKAHIPRSSFKLPLQWVSQLKWIVIITLFFFCRLYLISLNKVGKIIFTEERESSIFIDNIASNRCFLTHGIQWNAMKPHFFQFCKIWNIVFLEGQMNLCFLYFM